MDDPKTDIECIWHHTNGHVSIKISSLLLTRFLYQYNNPLL